MDWIKKQITIAQQNMSNPDGNSDEESETFPMNNKGQLIMFCHVIKDDFRIQKNMHLDFYSGQVYFTKGNKLVKSFNCADITAIVTSNDLLCIDYRKKYQLTTRQKRMQFSSSFECTQVRNHLKFIGESGQMLRSLFLLIDRDSIDSICIGDLQYAFKVHDIQVPEERCKKICENLANPKEIITTHLVDSEDGIFDYIQFFHAFFNIWILRGEHYAPKSFRECLLNWLYYSNLDKKQIAADVVKLSAFASSISTSISSSNIVDQDDSHTGEGLGQGDNGEEDGDLMVVPRSDGSDVDDMKIQDIVNSNNDVYQLIAGEKIQKVFDCIRWSIGPKSKNNNPAYSFSGTMRITDFRIILEVGADSREIDCSHSRYRIPPYFNRLVIPLHSVSKILVESSTGTLQIFVKDTRTLLLTSTARDKVKPFAEQAIVLISRLAFPGSLRQLKLFGFRINNDDQVAKNTTRVSDSWESTEVMNDYKRMKIEECSEWKIYENASDWKLCDSYPPYVIIPAKLKQSTLFAVAEHRSKGRLPVVTYRHAATGAVLVRSAQPLVGITQKSSQEDAFIMECFRLREKTAPSVGNKLYILDMRRQIAAAVNMAAGKGTEDVSQYTNTELIFCNIDNIHVMRSSLDQLADIVNGSTSDLSFFGRLDECGWLKHIGLLLASSVLAAEKIHLEEATVLAHCSDGFDRTAQMCVLAQLILDPYYRTIEGFAVLIEKDWCAFGHKFKDRCGHGLDSNVAAEERCPIFLQQLDAIHQLLYQFPTVFEFSEQLLIYLCDHSTSCLYGNFIGNSYRQRHLDLSVKEKTKSIWDTVFANKTKFINFNYKVYEHPIWPSSALKRLRLWERYFLRFDPTAHPNGVNGEEWIDYWDELEGNSS